MHYGNTTNATRHASAHSRLRGSQTFLYSSKFRYNCSSFIFFFDIFEHIWMASYASPTIPYP